MTYDCPMCGQPVPNSLHATLWHCLTKWHNPLPAFRHEWRQRPVFLLVALTVAFLVGMGFMAAILQAFGQQ